MTVCYAYEYEPCANAGKPCAGCGHYYWEHSHWLSTAPPKPHRNLIHKHEAMDFYDWYHATREPGADVRPRYQMMMDRQPGACEWVKARMSRELERRADIIAAYKGHYEIPLALIGEALRQPFGTFEPRTEHEQFQSFAGDIDESRPTFDKGGIQTEPIEITTYGDLWSHRRRWLMPDGTTEIVETHYPENTP